MPKRPPKARKAKSPADQSSNEHEPSLRLRFDAADSSMPTSKSGPPDGLDHVLSDVEQLSHGIDAMLHSASRSAIGVNLASVNDADDDDDPDHDGDDPMITMFDEAETSDIHAIDRMLAGEAQQLLPSAMGSRNDDEPEADAHHEIDAAMALRHVGEREAIAASAGPAVSDATNSEVVAAEDPLEGDFDSFESLIGSLPSLKVEPVAAPKAALAVSDLAPDSEEQNPAAATASIEQPPTSAPNPVPSLGNDAPLQPADAVRVESFADTQAAALVQQMSASAAQAEVAAHQVNLNASPAEAATAAAAAATDTPTQLGQVSAASSAMHPNEESSADAPSAQSGGSGLSAVLQLIAVTNLPLRVLPPSLKPMVNALALSLLVWVPAIWTLAPRLAARHAEAAIAMIETPAHGESTNHAEEAGDESAGHGAPKSDSRKKSAPAKKSSSKASGKSKGKKTDAGHASGGGH